MPRGGQNIKPVEDHIKKGNYRPSRHKERAVTKVVATIPDAPEHFSAQLSKMWVRVCGWLKDNGVLGEEDFYTVQLYCEAYETKERARISMDGKEVVNGKLNPWFKVQMEANKTLTQLGDRLGFSAKARAGIKVTNKQPDQDDALTALLKASMANNGQG